MLQFYDCFLDHNSAKLIQDGGTLTGAGTLTVTGSFDWTAGTQGGTGKTALAQEGTG